MKLNEVKKGHIALVFFSMFVAGTYSLGGLAAPFIEPAALMAMRFILAALLMAIIVFFRFPRGQVLIHKPWRYLLLGTIFAIYFVALFKALQLTDSVSTGAMFTLTPFFTAGFAYLLIGQKTSLYVLLALSIAMAGAVWVIFKGDWAALLAFELGQGEKIFLIGIVAHAFYIPLAKMLDNGEPVMIFTLGVLAGGSIPLLLLSFTDLMATDWADIPQIVWIALTYMVVIATVLTFALMQYGIQRLPAVKVMAYTYLIPSWVIVWNLFLGQGMAELRIQFGIALTILAMLLLLRR